ncbi:MAG: tetratricopeptide repeat protein, partial [Myxococcota bacterium]
PLQQYLIAFPDGRLQALGIAWDARPAAAGGQRWFSLYPQRVEPGDPLHWTGIAQTWNRMCAECHSTQLRKGYDVAADRYETRWEALDVSCEACHGPGSAHVAWADQGGDPDAGLAVKLGEAGAWQIPAAADTARRTPTRATRTEVETCARCHARRALLSEDYVHGSPLLDTHRPALLEEGLYHADGQILDEVYVYGSFLQSRMYAAGVSCSDCHEPHALTLRAEGNALCGQCHRAERYDAAAHHHHAAESAGARCVACHMPARVYMGVDARRDHGFRVPRPDLSSVLGTPNACDGCHADRSGGWAAVTVSEWRGGRAPAPHFAEVLHAGRRGLPGANAALVSLGENPEVPAIVRATALALLAPPMTSAALDALRSALRDSDPLVRLAAVEAVEALPLEARAQWLPPLLGDPLRGVRIAAARALAALPAERLEPGDARALAAALAEYRDAQRTNADGPEAHLSLGALHTAQGDLDAARAAYEQALRLDPSFLPSYVNLADLHRMAGRDELAEQLLWRALDVGGPETPDVHHAFGLLRVRQERFDEALELLRLAAEGNPRRARYAYVYGVALHSQGRTQQALEVLERAHARRPGDPELLLGLATIRRDAGDRAGALRHARALLELAPEDPAARALVGELDPREESAGGSAAP